MSPRQKTSEQEQPVGQRYPRTPDGRYFVVKQQLWRCTNPDLPEAQRQALVSELMTARREVKQAKQLDDAERLRQARARVDTAKVALGERGPVWWDDGAPDFNRRKVAQTPYAEWFEAQPGEG
ncbi:hypothetical protein G7007_19720 [Pseudomonas entomophila]|uniref:hypothetical protein n=1 Tax=Pseudomonas entomophila TaxID=312306 RepID=UPI0015E4628F|nr:hypothetical protein [Pseudomonas entomophila]MBA1195053.1 hypothetical protein [Pseudomonas entomophila]